MQTWVPVALRSWCTPPTSCLEAQSPTSTLLLSRALPWPGDIGNAAESPMCFPSVSDDWPSRKDVADRVPQWSTGCPDPGSQGCSFRRWEDGVCFCEGAVTGSCLQTVQTWLSDLPAMSLHVRGYAAPMWRCQLCPPSGTETLTSFWATAQPHCRFAVPCALILAAASMWALLGHPGSAVQGLLVCTGPPDLSEVPGIGDSGAAPVPGWLALPYLQRG